MCDQLYLTKEMHTPIRHILRNCKTNATHIHSGIATKKSFGRLLTTDKSPTHLHTITTTYTLSPSQNA